MANPHVSQRIQELFDVFRAVSSKGRAKEEGRDVFIRHVLSNLFGPPFRIGKGDVIDSFGNRSGRADVVIELGNAISFPEIAEHSPHLYLAEGVVALIEIKDDLSSQWGEVVKLHSEIAKLQRNWTIPITTGEVSSEVPHFAVGFKGWNDQEMLKKKMREVNLDGILVLDSELYVGRFFQESGIASLFAFLMTLEKIARTTMKIYPNYEAYLHLGY